MVDGNEKIAQIDDFAEYKMNGGIKLPKVFGCVDGI
jgi:hypothetical protein